MLLYKGLMMDKSHERTKWILTAAVIALAIFLRFFRLGHQSLWIDEVLTIGSFGPPPPGIPYWKKLLWDVHGPLYSMFMHFWSLASNSEVWLRAPGAAAGVLSVIFFNKWLRMITDESTALTGTLFLAISPFSIYYSQELRFYSFLTLFVILALIAYARFIERPDKKRAALLGLAVGVASLSHFMALFLAAGLAVHMAVSGRMGGRWLRPAILAAAIALLMVSPWIYREIYFLRGIEVTGISDIPDEAKLRGKSTFTKWSFPYILYAFSTGYTFGPGLRTLREAASGIELLRAHPAPILIVYILFGFLAASGLVKARRRKLLSLILSVSVTVLAMVMLAAWLNIKVFNIRYLVCVFPVFMATIAIGTPASGRFRAPVILAAVLVMGVADWNYHMVPGYARDDIRGAARIIERLEEEGETILSPGGAQVIMHYYKGENRIETYAPKFVGREEALRRLAGQIPARGAVWYLGSRQWDMDPEGVFPELLSSRADSVMSWDLPGVKLSRYLFREDDGSDDPIR